MAALTDLIAEPGRAALFFDVDGVLAPIVERPADARVPEETRAELRRLAARYALVACVTGRPSAVAREVVGRPRAGLRRRARAGARPGGGRRGPPGSTPSPARSESEVERKPLSVAYHFRTAADPDAARAALADVERAAAAEGFRTRWGRMVLEILPPVDATKGTAVRHLLAAHGLERALYAGDDTTDLDGFAALDGLEVAVRVAVASSEGPAELRERADIVLPSADAVLGFLREL